MNAWRCGVACIALIATVAGGAAPAQERRPSSFLVINQERILTGSETGKQLLAEEEKARDALRAEARAIDSSFEAEEQRLTEMRTTLSAEDFRAKADDFDGRVVKARQDQDARSSALAQDLDRRRRQFYAAVGPILVTLMDRYEAHAIFDENSVLVVDEALNITANVIAEIDAQAAQAVPVSPAVPEISPPSPEAGATPASGDRPAGQD